MPVQTTPRARATSGVLLLLVALLIAACGDSAAAPVATSTHTATANSPTATTTSTPATSVLAATPGTPNGDPPQDTRTPPARCPDPYPSGVPYKPRAGQPIRLQPLGTPPPIPRYEPAPIQVDPALDSIVRRTLGRDAEHVAVVIKNLADGRGVDIDRGRVFYAASLYKMWVMLEVFHQRDAGLLNLDEEYIVSEHYGTYQLNPGELEKCSTTTLSYALARMMRVSDNVAANLLLDRVGVANTDATLRNLGLFVSGIERGTLVITAGGVEHLLEAIASGETLGQTSTLEMINLLASESISDRLPALLPAGTVVAHKTGNWEDATHDAGIVYSPQATYIIVALSDFGYGSNGAGVIARLSRAVYDYYNPP